MTYKLTQPCNLLCHLKRVLRRLHWKQASKPIGQLTACSYTAVKTHFSQGKY
jgi:hypothetical protein